MAIFLAIFGNLWQFFGNLWQFFGNSWQFFDEMGQKKFSCNFSKTSTFFLSIFFSIHSKISSDRGFESQLIGFHLSLLITEEKYFELSLLCYIYIRCYIYIKYYIYVIHIYNYRVFYFKICLINNTIEINKVIFKSNNNQYW